MSVYDFTSAPMLQSFPWEETFVGLARANKTITTFYGDEHSKRHDTNDQRWKDRNEWRWYNVLRDGLTVEGFNVNVTSFIGEHWWARIHEPVWLETVNAQYFDPLLQWITDSGIFNHTGRILFFIQLQNQGSPQHIDFDVERVPQHLRQPSEFLWLTPPTNPKKLLVDGELAPWACWFNHFKPHGTVAQDRPQWSLRVDGKFTDEFRNQYIGS
jgi:hypothetical protein